jgi:tetratricopeptide (TPR) repeat protein
MARKKHAKREPDVLQRALMSFFQQLSGGGLILAGVVVLVLLVLAVLWGFSSSREKSEAVAWEKVSKALETRDPAKQFEAIEEAMNEVSDSEAHPTVTLVFAGRLHDKAIYDRTVTSRERVKLLQRAGGLCEGFLKNYPDHRLAVQARARLALVLEDAGEYSEAFAAFGKAAEACQETDFSGMQGQMLFGQARCAKKLNRRAEALQLLETAMARAPVGGQAGWRDAARQMHDALRSPKKDLRVLGAAPDEKPPEGEKKPPEKKAPEKKAPKKSRG